MLKHDLKPQIRAFIRDGTSDKSGKQEMVYLIENQINTLKEISKTDFGLEEGELKAFQQRISYEIIELEGRMPGDEPGLMKTVSFDI